MASKNLGAVIQKAISDGAFRRQLQSDPAAALRGFNLSPDEIAAIRSGDSSKLMSLGVDQRMSKVFAVGGAGGLSAARATSSDLAGSNSASTIANDPTAGTREGIVGDPTSGTREAFTTTNLSGARAINDVAPFEGNAHGLADPTVSGTRAIQDSGPTDLRAATTIGDVSGTRAVHDVAPFGTPGTSAVEDPNAAEFRAAATTGDVSGARAVHDVAPFGTPGTSAVEDPNSTEFAAAQSSGDVSGARAVHDVAPFGTPGTSAVEDPNAAEFRAAATTGDVSSARPVNDSEPFAGNAIINDNLAAANAGRGGSLTGDISGTDNIAAASAGRGGALTGDMSGVSAGQDPYSGQYNGVSPDFQAGVSQSATEGAAGSGGNMIAADDNFSVASRMADAGTTDAVRAINDVAPFEGNANAAAPSGNEFLGGDARLDPGTDSAHGFVPSDSADAQREMLDGGDHGNALGNTGETGNEHGWG